MLNLLSTYTHLHGPLHNPCTRIKQSHGFAVGHIQRYGRRHIRIQGGPLNTTQQVRLDWVQAHKDLLIYGSSWCFIQSIT